MKSSNLTNHKVGIGLISFLFIVLMCFAMSATAGTISGRVTDGSAGISSVQVSVYDADQKYIAGNAYTDTNGDYTVNLSVGEYKVEFVPPYDKNYLGEWYNNKADFDNADIVTVTASATTANIDAVLEVGGSISGRMRDAGGVGVAGTIEVYNNYQMVNQSWVGSDGNYTVIGLPTENYKIFFSPGGNYLGEWYTNKESIHDATSVAVTAPEITANINATVAPGGGISGRITNADGIGISSCYIGVYDSRQKWAGSAGVDADGNYTITGLPAGHYKLK
ncbi:MAG: carboxypeptidase regulatory-like domain-containing protein [Candidatus Electrothrix sp. AR1]|nr:carboxypeptidase regulatory-like domain-containing protein [Candidatus Electrothrix sp. AR1]